MDQLEKIQNILNGEPVGVTGVLKTDGDVLLLLKTTTGLAYVPYDFVKQHFAGLLIEFIVKHSKFKRFSKNHRR